MKNIKKYVRQSDFKMLLKKDTIDIENFTSIENISEREITIFNSEDKIKIIGNNMTIKKLLSYEILISGNIKNIIIEGLNE